MLRPPPHGDYMHRTDGSGIIRDGLAGWPVLSSDTPHLCIAISLILLSLSATSSIDGKTRLDYALLTDRAGVSDFITPEIDDLYPLRGRLWMVRRYLGSATTPSFGQSTPVLSAFPPGPVSSMMTNSHSDDPNDTSSTLPPELQQSPFLRTSSTLSPSGPLTFSTVIEDDHSRINAIAMTLGRALSRSLAPNTTLSATALKELRQTLLDLLNDLTWRLIRHDVSEDLIMRPAFSRYLGREGEEMGDHDRKDHEHARAELLDLYTAFETLPTHTTSADTSVSENTVSQFKVLARRYKNLMTELAEHMKIESGQQIPRLEGILGRHESEELARRYLATYVLEPGLSVKGRRVWEGGVAEYVRVGREEFARIWGELLKDGGRSRSGRKL